MRELYIILQCPRRHSSSFGILQSYVLSNDNLIVIGKLEMLHVEDRFTVSRACLVSFSLWASSYSKYKQYFRAVEGERKRKLINQGSVQARYKLSRFDSSFIPG